MTSCHALRLDHADGVLSSANVPRPGPPAALAGDIRGRGHPVASARAPHQRKAEH
jgi:hypothetical protein